MRYCKACFNPQKGHNESHKPTYASPICVKDAIEDTAGISILTGNTNFTEEFCARHTDLRPGNYVIPKCCIHKVQKK